MADINIVKQLREETGLSFNEINKALQDAGGDVAKAKEALKSFGAKQAAKKADREVKEGIVESYIHGNKKIGALVELLCETDFVAKNPEFQALAKDLAMQVAAVQPADVAELLNQQFIKDPAMTVKDLISQTVGRLGENIQINRFQIFAI